MTHLTAANKYISDILSGAIPACEYVRRACQRQLDDLKAAKKADFPYRFDEAKAERICKFLEVLPHTKGVWASRGETIKLEPWQQFIFTTLFGWVKKKDGSRRFREAYIEVPRKNGKALDVDTPIATPGGWKRHGDLAPGDYVFAPSGKPVMIKGVTEHYPGPCMSVKFSDGAEVVAHERHEWVTERTWYTKRVRGFRDKRALPVVETRELAETLRGGARGDLVHRVPLSAPLELPESTLAVPPYTLGAWLGDGTSRAAIITCADAEIIDQISKEGIPYRVTGQKGKALSYSLSDGDRSQKARDNGLASKLRSLGLIQNKRIPVEYMRTSRAQRMELLRGLVDTDGHITARGQVEIISNRKGLAEDIAQLVCTLGMKASICVKTATIKGRDCGTVYRVCFFPVDNEPLAYVERKRARQKIIGGGKRRTLARTVVDVQPVGARVVNCIEVEGGLYLAGTSLITTHNSIIGSGVGLYMFAADGEYGAEVYSGAASEKQAWEVFRPAKLMVERDSELRDHLGIQVNAKTLNCPGDMSRFEPIIGKPGDGSSPSCAIADEFHEHPTDEQVSTMITGMGARTQPLMLYITTAGVNLGGPCYAKRGDVIKVLEGTYDAPDVFGVIYTLDASDDWTSPEALQKANPNFGVSVSDEFLLAEQRKAVQSAHMQNNFKTKHLNIWCSASSAYFNMQSLESCADKTLQLEDFEGEECMTALDIGSKIDISGLVATFRRMIDGKWHYYAFCKAYCPEETAWDPKNKQYQAWANSGLLTVTAGNIIDYEQIEKDNLEWAGRFQIIEEAFDPWNAAQYALRMQAEGSTMVEVPQNVRSHSAPMKELEALIRSGRFHFDGSPLLKWMFSNVVAKVDANDNVFPRKERNENKIDLVVAIIMTIGRWIVREDEGGSVYESRGVLMI